jgi:hypothetical protein
MIRDEPPFAERGTWGLDILCFAATLAWIKP